MQKMLRNPDSDRAPTGTRCLGKKFASPMLRVYYKRYIYGFLKCPVLPTGQLFLMNCQRLAQQAGRGLAKAWCAGGFEELC